MIGAVVIGRNEGERLSVCLGSVLRQMEKVIYVDSGSSDQSVRMALMMNVEVVELGTNRPFTAARARNEGFQQLISLFPELTYVLFVDGDCEIVDGWVNAALSFLKTHSDVAVVCGRRRERFPEKTAYNLLCDMEWNTPVGEAKACGGDAVIRGGAFNQVDGFNPGLIAGEEPELCLRLRQEGWKVNRIDNDMTLHDANILHFSQWWKRNIRAGHAYAEGAWNHGMTKESYKVRESIRSWIWGLCLPVGILILSLINIWFLFLFVIYPLQVIRVALKLNAGWHKNWLYAFFSTLGKFPEVIGQIKYHFNRLTGSKVKLIEYKR